ncbi:MAG: FecR domain-containing protein [Planctomycetota bacterium]|nr:FecR domain-containing protein [Planctomycetota bacterium]
MTHLSSEDLDALAYGMLEEPSGARATAHVATCASCRAAYELRSDEARALRGHLASSAAASRPAAAWRPRAAWAAAILVAAGALFALLSTSPSAEREQGLHAERSTAPVHRVYRLGDGTEVVASQPVREDGWRQVRLDHGEYYFDVASAAGSPFRILTGGGEIRVLGTRFRVRYEEQTMNGKILSVLAVAVVGGAVVLLNESGSAILGPGESGEIRGEDAPVMNPRSEEPLLAGVTPEARIARLEKKLDEANSEVRRLSGGGTDPEAVNHTPLHELEPAKLRAEFSALLKKTYAGSASEAEVARLSEFTRDSKIMSAMVEDLEARVAADPNDLEARLGLVNVDSARLHASAGSIAERSRLSTRIRGQLDAVLERDPENWDARYQQAVGTSHSRRDPAGQAEAVRQFEALRAIQERGPAEARHSSTYVQLALVHLSQNNKDAARATIRAGFEFLPDDPKLKEMEARLATDASR